jgi:hypothetical protein
MLKPLADTRTIPAEPNYFPKFFCTTFDLNKFFFRRTKIPEEKIEISSGK